MSAHNHISKGPLVAETTCSVTVRQYGVHMGQEAREVIMETTNNNNDEFEELLALAFGASTDRLQMIRRIARKSKVYYEENYIKNHGY